MCGTAGGNGRVLAEIRSVAVESGVSRQELEQSSFLRRLHLFLTGCALCWVAFTLKFAFSEYWRNAGLSACAALLVAVMSMLRNHPAVVARHRAFAHVALSINYVALTGASLISGQARSMSLWFLTAVPVFAAWQMGERAARKWGAIVMATLLVQYAVGLELKFPAEFVASGFEVTMGQVSLTLLVVAFAVSTHRVGQRHLEQLHAREDEIARQAEALRISRDEAVRAEHAKGEFLANMSHEIRTPLNGVIGLAQVLSAKSLSEEQRGLVDRIQRSGNHLLAITNDILDYSKMESGHLELERAPVEVRALVGEMLNLFRPVAGGTGVALEASIDETVPRWVEGDAVRIRQVLGNLIGNAVKFTAHGRVSVQVSYEAPFLCVAVSDTGIGIPVDRLDRLFKEFSQVDSSTTRRFGGTGLGLSISRRLVEAAGGQIGVESQMGRGSTFTFTMKVPPLDALLVPSSSEAGENFQMSPSLSALRVLLAEDNPVNREVLAAMLGMTGCSFTIVENGLCAVEAASREEFDVVLLDMQMPVMDGAEAARQIRALSHAGGCPTLVAITANVLPAQRQQMFEAGVDDFLEKPVELWRLVRVLGQVVSGRGISPSPPPGPSVVEPSSRSTGPKNDDASVAPLPLMEDASFFSPLSSGVGAVPSEELEALGEVKALFDGQPERLARFLELHLSNGRTLLARAGNALADGDRNAFRTAVHTLRGSSLQFGACEVGRRATYIEAMAEDADIDILQRELGKLEEAVLASERSVRRELERLSDETPAR